MYTAHPGSVLALSHGKAPTAGELDEAMPWLAEQDANTEWPRGTLRDREDDVLSPEALVRRHAGYRNRVLMGPPGEQTCGPCASTCRS